jgi:hypothetical protein
MQISGTNPPSVLTEYTKAAPKAEQIVSRENNTPKDSAHISEKARALAARMATEATSREKIEPAAVQRKEGPEVGGM